jgi:hypothetical protein
VPLLKVKIGTYLSRPKAGGKESSVALTNDHLFHSFRKAVTEIVAGLLLIPKASRLELFPG